MKIEHHIGKLERFRKTIGKLDFEDDYETLIEDYMLAAAHLINACLHKLGVLREDKDVKHNQLYGFIKDNDVFEDKKEELVSSINGIEQLRPSHVYGKGENGDTAREAKELFDNINMICGEVLYEKKSE